MLDVYTGNRRGKAEKPYMLTIPQFPTFVDVTNDTVTLFLYTNNLVILQISVMMLTLKI